MYSKIIFTKQNTAIIYVTLNNDRNKSFEEMINNEVLLENKIIKRMNVIHNKTKNITISLKNCVIFKNFDQTIEDHIIIKMKNCHENNY